MNWNSLYSSRRTGDPVKKDANPDSVRTSFLRDYDRIIFASAFRRLQNKTQVFPLPGAVFVHNRLTHSLEVASVGRSLGKAVGDAIAEKYPNESKDFTEFYKYELSSVIAAACLAHDIGNPPFGHSGEDAIRTFFKQITGDAKSKIDKELTENQRKDFELFEGNSNALRILTHNFNEQELGGYKLTYATLASIVKYPSISASGFNKKSGLIATKKSGFFDSELDTYREIATQLNIPQKEGLEHVYARHPFVYLTEAADDICYRIVDMEDAHRLRIVSLSKIEELFLPFFDEETGYNHVDYIRRKMDGIVDDNQKVQYIRARWIGLMIDKLSKVFLEKETALLAGTLEMDLLKCLPDKYASLIDNINSFSVTHIYNHRSVMEIELAGYHVIGGLLKEFIDAVMNPGHPKSGKLLQLLPAQFAWKKDSDNLYEKIQAITDYISGMTDLYAIDMYRKITGISVNSIQL